jgi:hypothetical protein
MHWRYRRAMRDVLRQPCVEWLFSETAGRMEAQIHGDTTYLALTHAKRAPHA